MQRIRLYRRARYRKQSRKRRSGMTLIEVMIVMVIMSLVAVAAGFAVMPSLERARVRQSQSDAKAIQKMVIAYQMEYDGCPTIEDLLDKQILAKGTATEDAWGRPFVISCEDVEPTVVSMGRDGQLNTEDDLT